MPIHTSLDALPDYRKVYDRQLLEYVERQITDARKERLMAIAKERTQYLTFVAENLIDRFNIHAMIRTSECFGLQDFHNIGLENEELKPNKSVSKGALHWTHIHDYVDENDTTAFCIDSLKKRGYRIFATALSGDIEYTPNTVPIDKPLAIIMGSESNGISDTVRNNVDGIVKIPMNGFTDSFNVSVATALTAFPIINNIRESQYDWRLSDSAIQHLYYEWVWHTIRRPDIVYDDWVKRIKNNSIFAKTFYFYSKLT